MLKNAFFEIKKYLYRKYRRLKKYYTDPVYRNNLKEIKNDLRITHRELGSWGKQGADRARSDQYFLIISFTKVPFYAKFHAFIGKIAQLGGYTPLILNQEGNKDINDYYHFLGINEVLFWDKFVEQQVDQNQVQRELEHIMPQQFGLESLTFIMKQRLTVR